jgi:hypothetical protein
MWKIVLVAVGLAAAMIAAAELGYRVYGRRAAADHSVAGLNTILSATLSLMSLLIAFTFGMAESRYELRRTLMVTEANAISSTFLRQQQLAAPERARLGALMRNYVATRRSGILDETDVRAAPAAWRRTFVLQSQIWSATSEAIKTPDGARIAIGLLNATNQMIDVSEERRSAIEARLPSRLITVLTIFIIGASSLIGMVLASGGDRRLVTSSGMFILIALAMSLIQDLDTPGLGGIRTPVAAMDRAAQRIAGFEVAAQPGAKGPAGP